jgi:hypothetical protein
VTEPADLVHDVLLRVADFLRRLPASDLADLASGEAKLEVVPKGGRRPPARTATTAALPRPAEEIADVMRQIGDRASARQYLVDLKLTAPLLRRLAGELGITVGGSKAKVDELRQDIAEWAVGRRQDNAVIDRVGGNR